ncbi:unnamed protein product [Symbiodinium sp. KB8]|nr:unnamed protein product [Symbiodinium sp. KB8]
MAHAAERETELPEGPSAVLAQRLREPGALQVSSQAFYRPACGPPAPNARYQLTVTLQLTGKSCCTAHARRAHAFGRRHETRPPASKCKATRPKTCPVMRQVPSTKLPVAWLGLMGGHVSLDFGSPL